MEDGAGPPGANPPESGSAESGSPGYERNRVVGRVDMSAHVAQSRLMRLVFLLGTIAAMTAATLVILYHVFTI